MWDSESKKNSIHMLVKKYGINLDRSYAYGDTSGDFSMMKMVGYPTCVNPTRELLKEVLDDAELSKKINIIVERKDMIYKLKAGDIK
jgi:phosphoserine phosphatase